MDARTLAARLAELNRGGWPVELAAAAAADGMRRIRRPARAEYLALQADGEYRRIGIVRTAD